MFLLKKGANKYFADPRQSAGLGELFQSFDDKVIPMKESEIAMQLHTANNGSKKEMEFGSEEDDRQDAR